MGCPFQKYCHKKVNFNFYQNYCRGYYAKCETFMKKAQEEHTPEEWRKILEFGSIR